MDRDEVLGRVRALVAGLLDVPEEDVEEGSRFVEDLDADSLDLLELVVELKHTFGVTVSDDEVKDLLVELARFIPGASLAATADEAEFAEVTRMLTVGAIADFVADRTTSTVS